MARLIRMWLEGLRCRSWHRLLVAWVLPLALAMALAGCKTRVITQEVPVVVESVHESVHTEIVRDTLRERDSVYHFVHGDTVIIERWHHLQAVHVAAKTDTVRDTVPQVVEVVREVPVADASPKGLRWWEWLLIGSCAAVALWCIATRRIR